MKSLAVTMRTPGQDHELALGFLRTENIIQHRSQVISIKHCQQVSQPESRGNVLNLQLTEDLDVDWSALQRNFYTSSSCGVCGKASLASVRQACDLPRSSTDWSIPTALLYALPDHMRRAQAVFKHTGGLHAAALFDQRGKLLLMR
ncbi:MAG: formate dehydrogenase accessory sulfurtransferase FdhD, partial [Bacteroidota bacterium]